MKILIVDDDLSICVYIKNLLLKWGYQACFCDNAETAWEILQNDQINLLLTDWMMPGLNGIELIQKVRKTYLSQYLYIIILTAKNEQKDLLTGMESGADEFLTKPIESKELQVRINAAKRIISLEQSLQKKNQDLVLANFETQKNLNSLQNGLDAAAQLQQSLLPKIDHEYNSLSIDWSFKPADDLAGDLIGVFPIENNYLGFYLIDVSGHGIPPAMLSVYLHNRLQPEKMPGNLIYKKNAATKEYELNSPAEIIAQLNRGFEAEKHNMLYFTIVLGIINSENGHGQLCQGGHPYPLKADSENKINQLGNGGFPIGLMEDAEYENISFSLSKGEKLLFYSDGIIECMDNTQNQFGIDKLKTCFLELCQNNQDNISDKIINSLQKWQSEDDSPNHSFEDDVSLLLIEKT